MRRSSTISAAAIIAVAACTACSGSGNGGGFGATDQDSGTGGHSGDAGGGGNGAFDGSGPAPSFEGGTGHMGGGDAGGDAMITETTTIYAHTDDTLYSMDPQTKAVTLVGKFAGTSGATGDKSITDLAVNANGEVYVNSETVIYKAALPSANGGTVQLTKVASIAVGTNQKFFALAFVPAGVLGQSEALVGGDGNGEIWSIDAASGATKDLGNFGTDPNNANNVLGLSGDLVFYMDQNNKPTGLATVRSCTKGTSTCSNTSDYLVGVDMTNLAQAFGGGSPSSALLAGIYGGSSTMTGPGTGYGQVYGLGAWQGSVYGFSRGSSSKSPDLLLLDTSTGKGSVVSSSFSFTNGWSGAGVTTKVTVVVPPPPPPPPPPK